MRHRVSRLLLACVLFSIVFHFTIGPLLVWLFGNRQVAVAPQETIFIATSSALHITHRTRPARPQPVHKQPAPRPQPHAARAMPQPRAAAPRREIARIDPRAHIAQPTPQPTAEPPSLNIAAQQAQFEKTLARLREANNPVISAARSLATPEAAKNYKFNFSGAIGNKPRSQGILTPIKTWNDGGYDYYYVRYWVQYVDGSTETGIVPWPLRYLPRQDPFKLGYEHFPLPAPMNDFELPPGSELHPMTAYCYEHRRQFEWCPIYHD